MMPIDAIPDWEKRLARQDAFWRCEILDRPVVLITVPAEKRVYPWPKDRAYASHRERWMDTERLVESALASALNGERLGDALPIAWPNLGPEVFCAFMGMEMEYSADTSWGIPLLKDWADADKVDIVESGFYWRKMLEITDALLEAGRGKYYVGLTDFHPGGDAVAAFRDPMQLNLDLVIYPNEVKRLLERVNGIFFRAYDFFYDKLTAAGQAITSWPGIVSSKKWYVPSNDFSCMVSKEMFDEFFLDGIVKECRHYEACIYHLDGPGALHHLDSLLDIRELNAIQWVYGAGRGRASDWIHVYKRCQQAGKAIQIQAEPDELGVLMENLRPEGVWLGVSGVPNRAEAEAIIKRVAKWR